MLQLHQHGPITTIRMARSLLGRPVYWTAAYLVDGLLIDSGPACTAVDLVRLLGRSRVEQVMLTHSHEDHIGGLAALRMAFPDLRVYANWRSLPMIEDPARLRMQLYRRVIWGLPQPFYSARPPEGNLIRTPNYTVRVIETPGHSLDHVSLYEPDQRWLFSGDAFIGGQDRAWSPESDMFATIGSLRTMIALRPNRLFPGSGHVRKDPMTDLQGKLLYLTDLCAQVADLDAEKLATEQIVQRLFGGEPRMTFWTRGHFSAEKLVTACRSYNALVGPARAGSHRAHPTQTSPFGRQDLPAAPYPPSGRDKPSDQNDPNDLSHSR